MFPTQLRHQLRDAAYARLYASEKLAKGLLTARNPAHQRIILQEILDNGQKNLDQMAQSGDPYLMSSTYLYMAEASFDLSNLAENAAEKENYLHRSLDYADLTDDAALESEFSVVALVILPELLTLLTRALASANTGPVPLQKLIQNRIREALKELVDSEERQRRDRRQAALDLYTVQMLAESAAWLDSQADRVQVLQKALPLAQQTFQKARGAGDHSLTAQAQHTLAEIENGLKE